MTIRKTDVLLAGAGIMSATLGELLAQLDPALDILMVERLGGVARESSDALNNAGTGHAGYCELNYTPQQADGSVDIRRAAAINAAFAVSLQFWSRLVEQGALPPPAAFINPVPHQSFVQGTADVAFLRRRWEALRGHPLFAGMEYSDDPAVLRAWMPLVMQGRDPAQPVAATQMRGGADVDFGSLARGLVDALKRRPAFELKLDCAITDLKQLPNQYWRARLETNGQTQFVEARFVFLGAGGGTLPLLQKAGLAEAMGYGGFPVSGQWLVCNNPAIIAQHASKVYGKASVGTPPMSVPHLDARIIDGARALLFGPFAGVTTRFLKHSGSAFDLFASIKPQNVGSMLTVARDNFDLTRYLAAEAFRSHADRVDSLRAFYADAKAEDWKISIAGQRVQIIKKGGKLEFGTEIVTARDGTLAALLGASPGASTSVQAMLDVIQRCFAAQTASAEWQDKLKTLIPSYGLSLSDDAALLQRVRGWTQETLKL